MNAFTFETIEGTLPPEVKLVDQGLDVYNHQAVDLAAIANFFMSGARPRIK